MVGEYVTVTVNEHCNQNHCCTSVVEIYALLISLKVMKWPLDLISVECCHRVILQCLVECCGPLLSRCASMSSWEYAHVPAAFFHRRVAAFSMIPTASAMSWRPHIRGAFSLAACEHDNSEKPRDESSGSFSDQICTKWHCNVFSVSVSSALLLKALTCKVNFW